MNHEITRARRPAPAREFTVLLSPTRRGARLARLLATAHLVDWGLPDDAGSGRGLLIVEALADRWGVTPGPVPRKTVRAGLDLVP
ncbi:hypothetical protein [Streptomyces atroolivaceus]|uniref:hypothetical protein n=1 Tax=Streptomyces atroolivaceus TaxID=66869 RepID=UPI0037A80E9D